MQSEVRQSRTSVASMELFVTLFNGFLPLTNATKSSILNVVVVVGMPLMNIMKLKHIWKKVYILCNLRFINRNCFDFSSN